MFEGGTDWLDGRSKGSLSKVTMVVRTVPPCFVIKQMNASYVNICVFYPPPIDISINRKMNVWWWHQTLRCFLRPPPSACPGFPSLQLPRMPITVPHKGLSPTVPVSLFFGITGAGSGARSKISPRPGAGFSIFGIAVASLIFHHPRFRFPRFVGIAHVNAYAG